MADTGTQEYVLEDVLNCPLQLPELTFLVAVYRSMPSANCTFAPPFARAHSDHLLEVFGGRGHPDLRCLRRRPFLGEGGFDLGDRWYDRYGGCGGGWGGERGGEGAEAEGAAAEESSGAA